jgi:hypothetical protein
VRFSEKEVMIMSEPNETGNQTSTPNSSQSKEQGRAEPTREERLELIRRFQAQALTRPNPLEANLEMISSDLMLLAYRQREILEASLAAPVDSAQQADTFTQGSERYIRFVRQLDRLTQITRQVAGAQGTGTKSV